MCNLDFAQGGDPQRNILNDSDLVKGLRERNPAAVQHLHERYLPSVWRYVYVRVSGDEHLAEDIVSETVLALIRTAAKADSEIGNPGGWLRTVATNKVNDHFRAAARVQHLIDQVKQTTPRADEDTPVRQREQEERRAQVRGVLDTLNAKHRTILEWKYIDKLSVNEIADRLQTTGKAIESMLFRARRDCRERLLQCEKDEDIPKRNGQHPKASRNGASGPISRSTSDSDGQDVGQKETSAECPSAENDLATS